MILYHFCYLFSKTNVKFSMRPISLYFLNTTIKCLQQTNPISTATSNENKITNIRPTVYSKKKENLQLTYTQLSLPIKILMLLLASPARWGSSPRCYSNGRGDRGEKTGKNCGSERTVIFYGIVHFFLRAPRRRALGVIYLCV